MTPLDLKNHVLWIQEMSLDDGDTLLMALLQRCWPEKACQDS